MKSFGQPISSTSPIESSLSFCLFEVMRIRFTPHSIIAPRVPDSGTGRKSVGLRRSWMNASNEQFWPSEISRAIALTMALPTSPSLWSRNPANNSIDAFTRIPPLSNSRGHTVDVNQNIYAQTSMASRQEAVETLDSALVN